MHKDWVTALVLPMTVVVSPAFSTEYLSIEQTQQAIFSDATTFTEHLINISDLDKGQIKKLSGKRQRWDHQRVWRAQKQGKNLGWFLIDNVVGKHEFITYGVGISETGDITGIEIMTYRETHGDEVRDEEWRQNFTDKTLDDTFKLDEDIPNITGATLSARNITDGVKRLLALHKVVLRNE